MTYIRWNYSNTVPVPTETLNLILTANSKTDYPKCAHVSCAYLLFVVGVGPILLLLQ